MWYLFFSAIQVSTAEKAEISQFLVDSTPYLKSASSTIQSTDVYKVFRTFLDKHKKVAFFLYL